MTSVAASSAVSAAASTASAAAAVVSAAASRTSRAAGGRRCRRSCRGASRASARPSTGCRARPRRSRRAAPCCGPCGPSSFLPWSVSFALIRSSIARRICSCAFLSVASAFARAADAVLLRQRPVELARRSERVLQVVAELLVPQRPLEVRLDQLERVGHLRRLLRHRGLPFSRELPGSITRDCASTMQVMRRSSASALACAAVLAAMVYVWVAAVRAVPGVRRRKAEARARRRALSGCASAGREYDRAS